MHRQKCRVNAYGQAFSIDELLEIAQAQVVPEQQARHIALLEKNERYQLSLEQRQELSKLRAAAERLTV